MRMIPQEMMHFSDLSNSNESQKEGDEGLFEQLHKIPRLLYNLLVVHFLVVHRRNL